ncbi:MAG: SDR family oxidoreductase [Saprospiraceae bacterium]|nr:SDR family oxidoreductase [Saprospiraceae bacterium]
MTNKQNMIFQDKVVLITGACSGIGKIMARKSLERGANKLIAVDINQSGLELLRTEWPQYAELIYGYRIDLSDAQQIQQITPKIIQEVGKIDILINNAGIVAGKYFHELEHRDISSVMNVNANAMMHLTREILPDMMADNNGWICNICSMAGLISNPKMSVYVASKWAAVGWSDSLRLEMQQLNKKVVVTTIMPYFIKTGMFEGVQSKLLPIIEPEKAAEKIIRAIERERSMLTMPLPYWFVRLSQGILPLKAFDWVMRHIFGAYDTMQHFTGRKA